jgi:hypothetical protein
MTKALLIFPKVQKIVIGGGPQPLFGGGPEAAMQ